MDGVLDNLLIHYQFIKGQYHANMTVAELEGMLAELKKHNENFQKALELASAYGTVLKVSPSQYFSHSLVFSTFVSFNSLEKLVMIAKNNILKLLVAIIKTFTFVRIK
jgi:hypothetical protein